MDLIAKRRKYIGTSIDMAVYAAQLLEKPDGRRDIARRVTSCFWTTNPKTFTNLCSDPNDNLYITELLHVCNYLGISVLGTNKAEIITRIKEYVREASICTENVHTVLPIEASEMILRANQTIYHIKISSSGTNALSLSKNGQIKSYGGIYNIKIKSCAGKRFIDVSCGYYYSLALTVDGTILGNTWLGPGRIPKPNKRCIAISAGGSHSLALKEDGKIMAWGDNRDGQCDVPLDKRRFIAISAGGGSMGLTEDGKIHTWGWGNLDYGQSIPTNVRYTAISAGGMHYLALTEDGKIIACGSDNYRQCRVPVYRGKFIAISSGGFHSIALRDDGMVIAWGHNYKGQCDIPFSSDMRFKAICAGSDSSFALTTDDRVLGWGEILPDLVEQYENEYKC